MCDKCDGKPSLHCVSAVHEQQHFCAVTVDSGPVIWL